MSKRRYRSLKWPFRPNLSQSSRQHHCRGGCQVSDGSNKCKSYLAAPILREVWGQRLLNVKRKDALTITDRTYQTNIRTVVFPAFSNSSDTSNPLNITFENDMYHHSLDAFAPVKYACDSKVPINVAEMKCSLNCEPNERNLEVARPCTMKYRRHGQNIRIVRTVDFDIERKIVIAIPWCIVSMISVIDINIGEGLLPFAFTHIHFSKYYQECYRIELCGADPTHTTFIIALIRQTPCV